MGKAIITVEGLGKRYNLHHQARSGLLRDQLAGLLRNPFRRAKIARATDEEFWALRDVNFSVNQGDVVGIIGRNGAGKSTLLKILSRITEPTTGRITIQGRIASLLEVGTGFHGELSGRENIFLNGAILGMKRAEIRKKFDEIVAFSEVEKFLDTPVKHYSSGMYVRLAFAVAAHLEPEILIVDEVLAVGDASFQKKCLGKMQTVSREEGRMVLFVSHNLQQVRQFCRRGLLLQAGRVVADGNIHSVLNTYHSSLESSSGNTREDGQTRIETIRFVNAMGAAVERVDRGDEMHFVAEVRVNIEIVRPLLSIALLHGDQQPVFSEFWQIPFALPVGLHRIRGHFATSVLKPEAYFFTTFLYEGETCLDKLEGQSLPEIVDLAGDPLIEARRWGVVRVPVTWDMN